VTSAIIMFAEESTQVAAKGDFRAAMRGKADLTRSVTSGAIRPFQRFPAYLTCWNSQRCPQFAQR